MTAHRPHLPSDADFQGLVLRTCRRAEILGGGRAGEPSIAPRSFRQPRRAGQFSEAQLGMPCTFKGHEQSTMVGYKISWAFSEFWMQGFLKKPFGTKKGDGRWELSMKGRAGRPLR